MGKTARELRQEWMAKNPGRRAEKTETVQPKTYSSEEIQAIVDQLPLPKIKKGKPVWEKPSHFWVPLLAMFTGMRKSETAHLYKNDIAKVDGVPCIRIDNTEEGQSLKTTAWRRYVPIHSQLTSLGFIEFATAQDGPLFPELRRSGGVFGINYIVGRLQFSTIRRGIATKLHDAEVCEELRKRLLGRNRTEVSITYGDQAIKALQETVEKIGYPGVNLDRLKMAVPPPTLTQTSDK
jgi:integrase